MEKENLIKAFDNISKIEDLFLKAEKLFNEIEPEIQEAIFTFHNEIKTIQYCLRLGLYATKDIRKDWHKVVSEIPCEIIMTQEAEKLYFYTISYFNDDLKRINISCVASLIAIRQVVRRVIDQYIKDYCCDSDEPFTREDLESVSRKILSEREGQ